MTSIIDRLSDIARDLDVINLAMIEISVSQADLQTLDALAASLKDTVACIESKTGTRTLWREQAWKDSEPHRLQAQVTIAAVIDSRKLRNAAVFRRNIKLIYQGPRQSEFDSKDTTSRKGVIQKRCHKIQQLSPDGIVSWAIAYPPSTWGPCFMSNDIFDCLVEDIEPRDRKEWPEVVPGTLSKLTNGEMKGCRGLEELVHGLDRPPRQEEDTMRSHEIAPRPAQAVAQDPNDMNREMKHMFTNGPAPMVMRLPQPFRAAVRNSAQWKWERSRGHGTTACVATLFPKDETQDVSFTIWVGHNDGYRLNDIYGVKHAFSS